MNLYLYTDDPKALTLFLLNRCYRFEESSRSTFRGGGWSHFQISLVDEVTVTRMTMDRDDERQPEAPYRG